MSIGKHSFGKMFMTFRSSINGGLSSMYTHKGQHLHTGETQPYDVDGITAQSLPKASQNPYRKRPVKIIYDKNDFQMFRLPSEKAFLLNGFDSQNLFGARTGLKHSPHIRAQMDLDTNLVWAYLGLSLILLMIENKRTHDIVALRRNMLDSDKGFFAVEDFN